MTRYRHQLTIAESLELLRAGHRITCADGESWFDSVAFRVFGNSRVSHRAFVHLADRGYIRLAAEQPARGCWFWEPVPEKISPKVS